MEPLSINTAEKILQNSLESLILQHKEKPKNHEN